LFRCDDDAGLATAIHGRSKAGWFYNAVAWLVSVFALAEGVGPPSFSACRNIAKLAAFFEAKPADQIHEPSARPGASPGEARSSLQRRTLTS
jgi:hypothetical protein